MELEGELVYATGKNLGRTWKELGKNLGRFCDSVIWAEVISLV